MFEAAISALQLPGSAFGRRYASDVLACGVPRTAEWIRRRTLGDALAIIGKSGPIHAVLVDRSAAAVESTRKNIARFAELLRDGDPPSSPPVVDPTVICADVFETPWIEMAPDSNDDLFIPLNPPYGRRLHASSDRGGPPGARRTSDELYRNIGSEISSLCGRTGENPGRSVYGFVLCPDELTWRSFRRAAAPAETETSHFTQGGLDIRICAFRSPSARVPQ